MITQDPFVMVLAGYAAISALHHFLGSKAIEKYALAQGMLSAERTVKLTALLLLGIAVALILDKTTEYAAYVLAGFMVLSALTVHKFWNVTDLEFRVSEGLHFVKNFAFAGLILVYFML